MQAFLSFYIFFTQSLIAEFQVGFHSKIVDAQLGMMSSNRCCGGFVVLLNLFQVTKTTGSFLENGDTKRSTLRENCSAVSVHPFKIKKNFSQQEDSPKPKRNKGSTYQLIGDMFVYLVSENSTQSQACLFK